MLAGDDGAGDLASREDACGGVFDFGAAGGVMREGDQGVRSVEPYADKIDL
jgi:hypothetical protein